MMKKIIVTGSEGFIGKALCQELLKRAVKVIGIDRKNGDEASNVHELLKNGDIDCVFHLAAQTSVFNGNLEQIRKDNIDTFMRVADSCNQFHVKLVYASSSTANPVNTTSLYGISKYFDEQYASIYCKTATGCRLHNVYSPNPRERTLLWFLLNEERVSLYNCGQNIRCFTYIDDIIEGLIFAIGCNRQLINICNVQPVTTMYFSTLVKYYKPLEIELINEKREFDNLEQSVNRDIYLVPLSYTSVEDGVRKVFAMRRKDNSQKNAGAEK
ncbi:NAD-dependent epimerase/dehydratase family protein [Bacteroides salyersiae]|uniref:NAD-dependent epimerase/dehydratase family protein n=1 Tax=Bacteroides salyersiae TaxID=291644 RepID=UPI003DA27C04